MKPLEQMSFLQKEEKSIRPHGSPRGRQVEEEKDLRCDTHKKRHLSFS